MPDGLEGVRKVLDTRLLLFYRPTDGQDVEPRCLTEKPMLLQKRQSQLGQPPLFLSTH